MTVTVHIYVTAGGISHKIRLQILSFIVFRVFGKGVYWMLRCRLWNIFRQRRLLFVNSAVSRRANKGCSGRDPASFRALKVSVIVVVVKHLASGGQTTRAAWESRQVSLRQYISCTRVVWAKPGSLHSHTRLTALCPGLPGWAGTRKVKPIWFYRSKRQWVAVASAGPYASLHLAPDK